jgi:hypothetical protein
VLACLSFLTRSCSSRFYSCSEEFEESSRYAGRKVVVRERGHRGAEGWVAREPQELGEANLFA